jgi:hypothetical protein
VPIVARRLRWSTRPLPVAHLTFYFRTSQSSAGSWRVMQPDLSGTLIPSGRAIQKFRIGTLGLACQPQTVLPAGWLPAGALCTAERAAEGSACGSPGVPQRTGAIAEPSWFAAPRVKNWAHERDLRPFTKRWSDEHGAETGPLGNESDASRALGKELGLTYETRAPASSDARAEGHSGPQERAALQRKNRKARRPSAACARLASACMGL